MKANISHLILTKFSITKKAFLCVTQYRNLLPDSADNVCLDSLWFSDQFHYIVRMVACGLSVVGGDFGGWLLPCGICLPWLVVVVVGPVWDLGCLQWQVPEQGLGLS